MDFRILGPLEVRDGEREVRLRGGKQRALLALLLVNADRTLAVERIVDELWGEDVPETAQKMVQIYVSHLRKVLPPGTLHTRPPGYAVVLEREQLDLHRISTAIGPDNALSGPTPRRRGPRPTTGVTAAAEPRSARPGSARRTPRRRGCSRAG